MATSKKELDVLTNAPKPMGQRLDAESRRRVLVDIVMLSVVAVAIVLIWIFGVPQVRDSAKMSAFQKNLFDKNRPVAFLKDGKYGYVTLKGKVVVEPQFDVAYRFNGDYAVVGKRKDDITRYAVISRTGGVITDEYDSRDAISFDWSSETWLVDGVLYDKKFRKLSDDGLEVEAPASGLADAYNFVDTSKNEAGIMNAAGKILLSSNVDEMKYELVSGAKYSAGYVGQIKEHYCLAKKTEKVDEKEQVLNGVINCASGNVVIPFSEATINDVWDGAFEIYAADEKEGDRYVYIWDDKIVFDLKETEETRQKSAHRIDYYGKYILKIVDKSDNNVHYYDFLNKKNLTQSEVDSLGQEIFDGIERYRSTGGFEVKTCGNGRKVLIDEGKQLGDCEWDGFEFFDADVSSYLRMKGKKYALGLKDSNYYLIDAANKNIVLKDLKANFVNLDGEQAFIGYRDKDGKNVLFSLLTGKERVFDKESTFLNYTTHAEIKSGTSTELLNADLKSFYVVK